jgi:hypothetical protein
MKAVSCGLYALSSRPVLKGGECSAVYALLHTGLLAEEVFFPLSKCEIREVFKNTIYKSY